MSKSERNAQLNSAIEQFLLNGGQIQTVPAKKVKVRVTCSGRMKSANTGGGLAPVFKISSLYFQGEQSAINSEVSESF